MSSKASSFEKAAGALSNYLNWIAGAALVAMLALIVADIIASSVFSWPIPGGIEIVGFLGVVIIAFSIAYTQLLRGHIEVEFLSTHLPRTVRKIANGVVYFLGMALFALLAWKSYEFGRVLQVSGEVSMTQEIPFYPFVYGMAFCSISVFLVLLAQWLNAAINHVKK